MLDRLSEVVFIIKLFHSIRSYFTYEEFGEFKKHIDFIRHSLQRMVLLPRETEKSPIIGLLISAAIESISNKRLDEAINMMNRIMTNPENKEHRERAYVMNTAPPSHPGCTKITAWHKPIHMVYMRRAANLKKLNEMLDKRREYNREARWRGLLARSESVIIHSMAMVELGYFDDVTLFLSSTEPMQEGISKKRCHKLQRLNRLIYIEKRPEFLRVMTKLIHYGIFDDDYELYNIWISRYYSHPCNGFSYFSEDENGELSVSPLVLSGPWTWPDNKVQAEWESLLKKCE